MMNDWSYVAIIRLHSHFFSSAQMKAREEHGRQLEEEKREGQISRLRRSKLTLALAACTARARIPTGSSRKNAKNASKPSTAGSALMLLSGEVDVGVEEDDEEVEDVGDGTPSRLGWCTPTACMRLLSELHAASAMGSRPLRTMFDAIKRPQVGQC